MKTKKKILGLGLGIALLGGFSASAQSGLEGLIVEKYYKSTSADQAADGTNPLPAGSSTYRVYADLADGWQLQLIYGNANHTLSFNTTTTFWNSAAGDQYKGGSTNQNNLKTGIVALDSWISLGQAATGNNWGVPKADDNNAANLVHTGRSDGYLANPSLPTTFTPALTASDGIQTFGGTPPAFTIVGIDGALQNTFNAQGLGQPDIGSFTTNNGGWSTTDLDTGATNTNRVLIGQFTTNGTFTYQFNIQLRNINTNVVEKYVPSNSMAADEFVVAALSGTVGVPPTVSVTSPANAASFYVNLSPVNVTATAADSDGSISSVQFFLDGVSKGTDNSSPYAAPTFSITSAGPHTITAVATDNDGNVTTSSTVTVTAANNTNPTVALTAPSAGTHFTGDSAGVVPADVVAMTATAADSDIGGSVDSVAFFINGVWVGSDNSSPYAFSWQIPNGVYNAKTLTAKAYDNVGGQSTSAAVTIIIDNINAKPYFVDNTDTTCISSTFGLPINAKDTVKNVIGFDLVLHYDKTKVAPTGGVTVASDLINSSYVTTSNSINSSNGTIYISVSLNNTAPNNTFFNGVGELINVQFNKTSGFASIDTALFSIDSIVESRYTGVSGVLVDPGKYITHRDSTFHASLVFWADNSPIAGGAGHLSTAVKATYSGAATVNPDASGSFSYVVNQSQLSSMAFNITRDIAGVTSVQSVVNGYDALMAKKVVMADPTFVPTVFQILAMDVNQDGIISAGDVTQINQRSVLLIPEFKQAWNYNAAGINVAGKPSKDWVFIDGTTLSTNGTYLISSVYPAADGAGYTKNNVPVPDTTIAAAVTNASSCPVISDETYTGVMLGDVNGNYKTLPSSAALRADEKIIIDLSNAIANGSNIVVPVSFASGKTVNALDLAVELDAALASAVSYVDALGNFNADDTTLRITSNSLKNYVANAAVLYLQIPASTNASALRGATTGYINGNQANVEVIGGNSPATSVTKSAFASAYPNPAGEQLNVVASEDATVELFDINGVLVSTTSVSANQVQTLNTTSLAGGVYTLKVYNATTISISKVVIAK